VENRTGTRPGCAVGGPGRPKGVANKVTREIKDAARQLVEDPVYRRRLRARLRKGSAPHMETLLHHYAFGKPTEHVEVKDVTDVGGMTYEEMVAELRELAERA
jgi:hypothetical protein